MKTNALSDDELITCTGAVLEQAIRYEKENKFTLAHDDRVLANKILTHVLNHEKIKPKSL